MAPDPRHWTSSLSLATALVLGTLLTTAGGVIGADPASLADDVDSLLARVPASHRDACRPELAHDDPDAVMSVRCELASGLSVHYTQMASPAAADARFLQRLEAYEIDEGSGDCSERVPAQQPYSIGGETAGRLMCYESFGSDSFQWTHDATGIYGQAILDGDLEALWSWWATESGPLTTPDDAPSGGLGAALEEVLLHVPEDHRQTCLPFDGGGPEDGVVMSVKCEVASDLTVYYSQYDSPEALDAAYQDDFESADVAEGSGDCSTALPGEMGYTVNEESAGRLLCTEFFDSVWFDWTHISTLISATASSERTVSETWDWWITESGPIG